MFELKNKSIVITGGGGGIGKAIAELFVKQGGDVHVIELKEISETNIKNYICDVRDQLQVNAIFNEIGKNDILVNCAGIAHIGCASHNKRTGVR